MVEYEIFLHVRRICDRDEVHTDRYQADAHHTHDLLFAVDPAVAAKFSKEHSHEPEPKTPRPRKEAHP